MGNMGGTCIQDMEESATSCALTAVKWPGQDELIIDLTAVCTAAPLCIHKHKQNPNVTVLNIFFSTPKVCLISKYLSTTMLLWCSVT